jgi:hypothetical protein
MRSSTSALVSDHFGSGQSSTVPLTRAVQVRLDMKDIELRIVSWNCAGGLRKKWHALAEFNADLLVIQECENPALGKVCTTPATA